MVLMGRTEEMPNLNDIKHLWKVDMGRVGSLANYNRSISLDMHWISHLQEKFFGKYDYLLSYQELDEKIDTTLVSVNSIWSYNLTKLALPKIKKYSYQHIWSLVINTLYVVCFLHNYKNINLWSLWELRPVNRANCCVFLESLVGRV